MASVKKRCGLMFFLLASQIANAESSLPGRLFFNQQERTLLEQQRRFQLPAETRNLSLSGEIIRHQGNAQQATREYLWLNGEIIPARPGLPDLRPGERMDLTRGEREGRISIEASRPKEP